MSSRTCNRCSTITLMGSSFWGITLIGNPSTQRIELSHYCAVVTQDSPQIGVAEPLLPRVQVQMRPQRNGAEAVSSSSFYQLPKVCITDCSAAQTEVFR